MAQEVADDWQPQVTARAEGRDGFRFPLNLSFKLCDTGFDSH
jgi:hypothetical protein